MISHPVIEILKLKPIIDAPPDFLILSISVLDFSVKYRLQ